jgi:hypothetical protein
MAQANQMSVSQQTQVWDAPAATPSYDLPSKFWLAASRACFVKLSLGPISKLASTIEGRRECGSPLSGPYIPELRLVRLSPRMPQLIRRTLSKGEPPLPPPPPPPPLPALPALPALARLRVAVGLESCEASGLGESGLRHAGLRVEKASVLSLWRDKARARYCTGY